MAAFNAGKILNNVMRQEYRPLNDIEKNQILQFKDQGQFFFELCEEIGDSRELSLAKTKIEEAVFWAVKHITK